MDHQQVISMKKILTLACLMFALPLKAEDQAMDLTRNILTLKNSEKPKFIDEAWKNQDYELVGRVLKEGDADLLKYLKIKLGNASSDEFKSKVCVLYLRAPEKFWNGSPPYSGTGTIDFAARRAILEVLTRNLEENLALENFNSSVERRILADKLEKSLGVKLPQFFSEDENLQGKSGGDSRENKRDNNSEQSTHRMNQKGEVEEEITEKKKSNLPWIIVGVLIVEIILLLRVFKGKFTS